MLIDHEAQYLNALCLRCVLKCPEVLMQLLTQSSQVGRSDTYTYMPASIPITLHQAPTQEDYLRSLTPLLSHLTDCVTYL